MAIKPAKPQQHGKNDKPRVIIKKVKGHGGGHHGGAWKVAYADFVTAMMALFLVLWLLGASNSSQRAVIAHYFREPGVFTGSRGIIPDGGADKLGHGIIQAPTLEVIQSHLKASISELKELLEIQDQIPITLTSDGLLIEIIDKEKQAFFDVSNATIKPVMRKVLELIVREIKGTPHRVVIGGHTDARAYHSDSYYSNWELSAARALNTRRAVEELGLPAERIDQVVGYADRQLRLPENPLSSENRRISILIRNSEPKKNKALP